MQYHAVYARLSTDVRETTKTDIISLILFVNYYSTK